MSRPIRQIDRFAELLSEHDADAGNRGGHVADCARRMGISPAQGNGILQRMRRDLGPQAR